jgi:hypothetical protein
VLCQFLNGQIQSRIPPSANIRYAAMRFKGWLNSFSNKLSPIRRYVAFDADSGGASSRQTKHQRLTGSSAGPLSHRDATLHGFEGGHNAAAQRLSCACAGSQNIKLTIIAAAAETLPGSKRVDFISPPRNC